MATACLHVSNCAHLAHHGLQPHGGGVAPSRRPRRRSGQRRGARAGVVDGRVQLRGLRRRLADGGAESDAQLQQRLSWQPLPCPRAL